GREATRPGRGVNAWEGPPCPRREGTTEIPFPGRRRVIRGGARSETDRGAALRVSYTAPSAERSTGTETKCSTRPARQVAAFARDRPAPFTCSVGASCGTIRPP